MIGPEPNGVVAVFASLEGAESALEWLRIDGIEKRSISILGPAKLGEERPPELDRSTEHEREVASYWARWGAMYGAVVGGGPLSIALVAATVGMGPLAVAVGVGVAALAATTGVGALASALIGVGIHDRQARVYEKAIADRKFVLVVHTDDPLALRTAKAELERLGAESVEVHGIRT